MFWFARPTDEDQGQEPGEVDDEGVQGGEVDREIELIRVPHGGEPGPDGILDGL